MKSDLHILVEKIMQAIQNQEYNEINHLDLILKSKDFLNYIEKIEIYEAELLYSKIQTALSILNTQKELLLDELTLLQSSKKALSFYTL